jgi:SAM-dependent methyltransferase
MEVNGFKIHIRGYFVPESQETYNNISYPESGNATISEIEAHSHWFNARNNIIAKTLEKYPFRGDFLDLGGGNGYQLSWLEEYYFRPRDISSAMVEPGETGCDHAIRRGVKKVFCCTHREFPFDAFQIGGIGLFDVLEHIEEDENFLKELAEKLPFGARIYITVPALKWLWSEEDRLSGHFRRFDKIEQVRIVGITGLKLIDSYYFFSYYVPFVWLLRVLPEKLGILSLSAETMRSREKAYHKGNTWVNTILNILHHVEQSFLDRSFKPLWGTSRMIVLEKAESK